MKIFSSHRLQSIHLVSRIISYFLFIILHNFTIFLFIHFLVNKSQSLPRGVITSIPLENQSNITTTSSKQSKKTFTMNSKTMSKSYDFDEKYHKDDNIKVMNNKNSSSMLMNKTEMKRDETKLHTEESFFRRIINRSGRKNKKEQQQRDITVTDSLDKIDLPNKTSKKIECTNPAIKKGTELSIINVLSKARTTNTESCVSKSMQNMSSTIIDELDQLPKLSTPKSGRISKPIPLNRQRNSTAQSVDIDAITRNELSDPIKTPSPHTKRQELATSYLRFSPPKSNTNHHMDDLDKCRHKSQIDNFIRTSHYRSEETLNTNLINQCDSNAYDDNETKFSVSLPKSVWPNESKFIQNATRNSYGWGQCQQKISKLTNEQQQQQQCHIKSPVKGKMVEKSKSFRLYTKNFNNDINSSSYIRGGEFSKSSLGSNMPSLPDLNNQSINAISRPSARYSSNREGSQLHRLSNNSPDANSKWIPTRSSSSSRLSEHTTSKFEINDMNLIPTNKLYSTLNASDDHMTTYDVDKNNVHNENSSSNNMLHASKTQNSFPTNYSIQNINEIEDNIDKIMKSSVVTVLKKSPTADLYQIKTNSGNVSLTTISNTKGKNLFVIATA